MTGLARLALIIAAVDVTAIVALFRADLLRP